MSDKITIITPTCDRPFGFRLAEKYVAAQTVAPFQWIVADGGQTPAPLTMGQEHVWCPLPPGPTNFTSNLFNALPRVKGDVVIFVEDDDVYLPTHFQRMLEELNGKHVTGSNMLNYYNLQHEKYMSTQIQGSSLSQTALRVEILPQLSKAIKLAQEGGHCKVDNLFWDLVGGDYTSPKSTVYGIKGIPGTPGMGIGHRPDDRGGLWKKDRGFAKLRAWLGGLADPYISVMIRETSET